jgi:predicted enzyme related to lactoylglutathione lyase
MNTQPHPTYGNGKICYIELPAKDIGHSSSFYQNVFGWQIRRRGDGSIAFDDAVSEVSGTFRTDRQPSTESGILIYIMVFDIEASIKLIKENGGKIIQPVGMDLPEITARFSDPAGNILGLYQQKITS